MKRRAMQAETKMLRLAASFLFTLGSTLSGLSAGAELPPPDAGRQTAAAKPGAPRPEAAPKVKVTTPPAEREPTAQVRSAYAALHARDYETATRLYQDLARTEPRSIDVLLGQAALAAQRRDYEAARGFYLDVLKLEPKNVAAQGGLLALFGGADYATAELRLKELIAREPNAFLHHALGTLYAGQGLWPQAQHAFFQAYHLDPASADHAYNLAVSLEHIGQRAHAATYYRRAVQAGRASRAAAFDIAAAEERAARLAVDSR